MCNYSFSRIWLEQLQFLNQIIISNLEVIYYTAYSLKLSLGDSQFQMHYNDEGKFVEQFTSNIIIINTVA